MENTMSRVLIETVVKSALNRLKTDPERGIRYLVDLALHFSGSPALQSFFGTAQDILNNENSPYYGMVRDLVSYADTQRLLRFGMDLGCNSCLCGARRIRESEQRLGCHIPWTVLLKTDSGLSKQLGQYDAAMTEGEALGIYTWMLFASADPESTLALVRSHPDSAFFLFCEPQDGSSSLLDDFARLENLMPVLRIRDDMTAVCAGLREEGIPYSFYSTYARDDFSDILTGDLLAEAAQQKPVFTVLLPRPDCPYAVRRQVQQAVEQARTAQLFATILWELEADNARVQQIIDGTTLSVRFDPEGNLLDRNGGAVFPSVSLFSDGLAPVLGAAFARPAPQGIA